MKGLPGVRPLLQPELRDGGAIPGELLMHAVLFQPTHDFRLPLVCHGGQLLWQIATLCQMAAPALLCQSNLLYYENPLVAFEMKEHWSGFADVQ